MDKVAWTASFNQVGTAQDLLKHAIHYAETKDGSVKMLLMKDAMMEICWMEMDVIQVVILSLISLAWMFTLFYHDADWNAQMELEILAKNVMMRTLEMEMDAIIIAKLKLGSFVQVEMLQM